MFHISVKIDVKHGTENEVGQVATQETGGEGVCGHKLTKQIRQQRCRMNDLRELQDHRSERKNHDVVARKVRENSREAKEQAQPNRFWILGLQSYFCKLISDYSEQSRCIRRETDV